MPRKKKTMVLAMAALAALSEYCANAEPEQIKTARSAPAKPTIEN
jgi:hypothetical protein